MTSLSSPLSRIAQWRWPLPAMLAWALCWLLFVALWQFGVGAMTALLVTCALGVALSLLGASWWRRVMIGAGFPLSLALSGVAAVPAWAWLLPLLLLLLIYPLNAWRDAPLFPTPDNALLELHKHAPLPLGALVLDAGCGLGHGLRALRQTYPQARLHGLEWSWPLRAACALSCSWARVRHGDIWREDWRPYSMVYMFQRPESMPRAVEKAGAELAPGAWLVSLEFEAAELVPQAVLQTPDGRPLWLYQSPFVHQKAPDAVI
ncbi:MAG: class I SAM-dependent methyltransferase [Gammaproteobacteria bacterium]|nr:class I SAM-dependent methyltransferase [Gammaproteobacteria bacterium]MBU0785328.1 class I SAM-dependent methyltransferase [Gammaproteobacteria bacterium]MBU0815911.1 class I SAM-dependent methyltransferase [Gammaproteobacteria bacterium]MBU1787450.1 class I SAM-dependent methyltransferase [Gammaproteobacteria bacterium]